MLKVKYWQQGQFKKKKKKWGGGEQKQVIF